MYAVSTEAAERFTAQLAEDAQRDGFRLVHATDTANKDVVGFADGFTGGPAIRVVINWQLRLATRWPAGGSSDTLSSPSSG